MGGGLPPDAMQLPFARKTTDLSPPEVASVLCSQRRATVVRLVDEMAPTMAGPLAEAVMAHEESYRDDFNSADRKRFYVSMIQGHLPKLSDWNVIEYDEVSKCVDRGPNLPGMLAAMNDIRRRAVGNGW